MTTTETSKQQPHDKVRSLDGSIEIAIWRNEQSDGKVSYSLSAPERTYKDKQTGEYHTTTTIFDRDAMEVSKLYSLVNDKVRQFRDQDYHSRKAANQESVLSDEAA